MRRLVFVLCMSACAPPPPLHWSYGESWTGLCATGKQQSPVALVGIAGFAPQLQMEYWASKARFTNNGHTIQLDYDPGSSLIVDGKKFALQQLHFHQPAEHTVDGKSFPLEIHLVHKNAEGKLAVVAILVSEGAPNRWLLPLLEALPNPGETREPTARVNAADLVPPSRRFLHYAGSLTAPPCSENVHWYVMRTPIEMASTQIDALAKLLGDNHRELQPLNGRHIVEGEVR